MVTCKTTLRWFVVLKSTNTSSYGALFTPEKGKIWDLGHKGCVGVHTAKTMWPHVLNTENLSLMAQMLIPILTRTIVCFSVWYM